MLQENIVLLTVKSARRIIAPVMNATVIKERFRMKYLFTGA
jgi:hypothetical protein